MHSENRTILNNGKGFLMGVADRLQLDISSFNFLKDVKYFLFVMTRVIRLTELMRQFIKLLL